MKKTDKPVLRQISIPSGNEDVLEWINNQSNFSKSIRMLIKMQMKMTGTEDIFEALLQNQILIQPCQPIARQEVTHSVPKTIKEPSPIYTTQKATQTASIPVIKTEPPTVTHEQVSNSIDIKAALDSIMG